MCQSEFWVKASIPPLKMPNSPLGGNFPPPHLGTTALDDGVISDTEFDTIIDEYQRLCKQFTEFDIDKIKEEAREEITKELFKRTQSFRKTS